MAFSASQIAPRLIVWPGRWREGIVQWTLGGSTLASRFAEHLASQDRGRHLEDFQFAVQSLAEACPGFLDWYQAVLEPFRDVLRFENGAPCLRQGALGQWRRITAILDADALVTLALAGELPRGIPACDAIARLPNWSYFISTGDQGLGGVLQAGLADIHVHFEASDPLPLLWLRIATERVRASELSFFSNSALHRLAQDEIALRQRQLDRETLDGAAASRRGLATAVDFRLAGLKGGSEAGDGLIEERALLLHAWQAILTPGLTAHRRQDLNRKLDGYLSAKNLFLQCHQQRAGEGPGLTRFRDYLDRGETLGERKRKKTKPAVRRQRFERMLSLATASPHLRTVELRIAPQDSLKGWIQLFRLWQRSFSQGSGVPSIRFVIHFIRKNWPQSDDDVEHAGLRRKLDRQTAVLQLFRHKCPELARHIVGIDVANLERGFPPQVFAPYLQLLRGETALAGTFDTELLASWQRLAPRDLHRTPQGLPRLGLTYHAGEDFHHPLDGLRSMAGLVDHVMTAGDRIGHGLAVGWDLRIFEQDRVAPMPLGVLLDNLIWLRSETSGHGEWKGNCQVEADKLIYDLAREFYGSDQGAATLERALAASFKTPRARQVQSQSPHDALASRIAFEPGIQSKRRRFSDETQSRVLASVVALIPAVQARLARRMRDRGVVVEACPTSNFVTGAVEDLSRHPYFSYLEALGDQTIVTINTDDPGVFGTTLEIEYALMFDAMLKRGMNRAKALKLLDQSRQLALDSAFNVT